MKTRSWEKLREGCTTIVLPIAVITFYLLRPHKLTNENQSHNNFSSHLPRKKVKVRILLSSSQLLF
jgi:hypothetical protein